MKYLKNIKAVIVVSIGLLALVNVQGQQEPQYTQYMFNMMSLNPAYAGTRNSLNALMLSRIQWVGIEGAPRSHTFAMHTPIKNKKMGIGASVIADNIGPINNTYFNANYSYRINLSENMTLSMGIKAGIFNYKAGLTEVELNEQDNSYLQDYSKSFQPNLGAGAYLYTPDFYVGLSVPKFIKTELENVGEGDAYKSEIKRHFFFTGGYVYKYNSSWTFKPSFVNKMVEGSPPSFDVTGQVLYNERIWLGSTYRIGDAIAFLFEVRANRQLTVGYSVDFTVSEMRKSTFGSHEIMISYDFEGFTNDRVKSPRYF